MMKRKNQILAVLLSASMIAGTLVQAVPVQAETQLVNVARDAVASTNDGAYYGNVISNVNDGNDNTNWQTEGKWPSTAILQLAGNHNISKVSVLLGGDDVKGRKVNVTVKYAQNSDTDNLKEFGNETVELTGTAKEITVATPVSASHIYVVLSDPKVVVDGNETTGEFWPCVKEIEVYGTSRNVDRSAIESVTTGSYESGNATEGDPNYVLDGLKNTMWHTSYSGSTREDQYLVFTFNDPTKIDSMQFLQRQNPGDINGKVTKFDLYTRESETDEWTPIIDDGILSKDTAWQEVNFPKAVTAKQVKFQVEEAYSDTGRLYAAAAEIRFTQVDYSGIDAAITAANAKVETNYTGNSWTALQNALTAANAAKNNGTQAQIDEATAALNNAISNLADRADFADLNSAIQAAEDKRLEEDYDNYTDDSMNNLNAKLVQAKEMAENTNATQEAVDAMAQAINDAIKNLQIDDAKVAAKELAAAKEALNAKIAEVQAFITANSKYDCRALEALIAEAQALVNSETADVDSVNDKADELTKAMDNFEYLYVIKVDGAIVATGAYNTRVTINAPAAEDGMKFAGWEVDGNIISTKEEYTFCIANSMEITAKFVQKEEAVVIPPSANMANTVLIKRADGKANARFVAQLIVPKGYTLVETGLLWCTRYAPETLHGENGAVSDGVKKLVSPSVNINYQFSATINGMPSGKFVRGMIYAKVKNNATDEVTWVYSEEEKIVYKK